MRCGGLVLPTSRRRGRGQQHGGGVCDGAGVGGSEARGRGSASHGPHRLLVPGPRRKASERTKARAQTGTQITRPRPLLSARTSQPVEHASILALALGQQGRPREGRAGLPETGPKQLPQGRGQATDSFPGTHPHPTPSRLGGGKKPVLRAPRLTRGCCPPLPGSLPIIQAWADGPDSVLHLATSP